MRGENARVSIRGSGDEQVETHAILELELVVLTSSQDGLVLIFLSEFDLLVQIQNEALPSYNFRVGIVDDAAFEAELWDRTFDTLQCRNPRC